MLKRAISRVTSRTKKVVITKTPTVIVGTPPAAENYTLAGIRSFSFFSKTSYPPSPVIDYGPAIKANDVIRLLYSSTIDSSLALVSPAYIDHTITDAELNDLNVSVSIPGLSDISTSNFYQIQQRRGSESSAPWPTVPLKHGDATAPVIMSNTNNISVTETQNFTHLVTANEQLKKITIAGGENASEFAISGFNIIPSTPVGLNREGGNATREILVGLYDMADNVSYATHIFAVGDVDEVPNTPTFVNKTNVARSTVVQADETWTVNGLASGVIINCTIENGTYSKNGAAFTNVPFTLQNGDQLQIRTTSAANYSTEVVVRLIMADTPFNWQATTLPNADGFVPLSNFEATYPFYPSEIITPSIQLKAGRNLIYLGNSGNSGKPTGVKLNDINGPSLTKKYPPESSQEGWWDITVGSDQTVPLYVTFTGDTGYTIHASSFSMPAGLSNNILDSSEYPGGYTGYNPGTLEFTDSLNTGTNGRGIYRVVHGGNGPDLLKALPASGTPISSIITSDGTGIVRFWQTSSTVIPSFTVTGGAYIIGSGISFGGI